MFGINPVVFADVFLETPCSELLFLFRKPCSGTREVGQDPHGNERNHYSNGSLNDEEPPPREVSKTAQLRSMVQKEIENHTRLGDP